MRSRVLLGLVLAGFGAAGLVSADGPAATLPELSRAPGGVARGGNVPCDGGEIYDDGGAENAYSGNPATVSNLELVQRFTPASYPATYDTVCVALISLAGSDLDLEIEIRADDGAGGAPGTLLGVAPVSVSTLPAGLPCAFYSFDISGLGLEIASGSVYIGARWNPMLFPNRFLCADEDFTTPLHPGYVNFNLGAGFEATGTVFERHRALLVRATGGPVVPSVLEVPALGGLGLAALVALLAGAGLHRLRRARA